MSNANSSSELLSAVDAVAVVSNLMPPRPVGALYLQNEDGTRSGKFFFKDGYIYAAKVDGYEFPLAYRAAHSGLIDEDDQRSALASAGGDPSNPLLVSIYLQRHLLDKRSADSYMKENFLAVSGALLSMNPVRAEWRDDEATEDFIVHYIDVPTLVSLCNKRSSTLQMAAERMGTTVEGLFSSPIKMIREVKDEDNLSVEAIWVLHKADGETPLDDAAAALGLTRLSLAKLVYRMWNNGIIEVLAPALPTPEETEPVSEEAVEEAVIEEETAVEETSLSSDSVPLYTEDVDEEDEDSTEPDIDEGTQSIALVDESGSEEIADPFEISSEPYSEDEESSSDTYTVDFAADESEDTSSSAGFFDAEPTEEVTPVRSVETPNEPAVQSAGDDPDEDFARLAQAIAKLTERARLANVQVETATRAVEDSSAAVRESEEEAAAISQVLDRLHEEVRAQTARLEAAESRVAELHRKEEENRVEAKQAQAEAALLAERLEKLRAAF